MDMENEIEEMEQYVRAQCPYCGEPEAPATGAGFSYCPACGFVSTALTACPAATAP